MNSIQVKADIQELNQVLSFIEEQLEATACSMKIQMQINVAVEEIFVNIAHYAYQDDNGEATIQFEIGKEPRAAIITFLDSGIPYNPLAKEDPDVSLSLEERKVGGLGIFMVKKTMDDVQYEYQNGRNILKLIKCL